MKQTINIVFIGHVDSGKSTLCGKLLGGDAFTTDIDIQEREQGVTINYGGGYFETENKKFMLLDSPGHRNYVPSMIEATS